MRLTPRRLLPLALIVALTGCKELKVQSDKEEYQFGEVASFWVLFKDEKVPDGKGEFTWFSKREKDPIGRGATLTLSDLPPGSHEIYVEGRYQDKKGKSPARKIKVVNEAPRALIREPNAGFAVSVGTNVTFVGSANDREDGVISGDALRWTSSRDGELGRGSTVSRANLSPGRHTITLTALDRAGAEGGATVQIEIKNEAPRVTVSTPDLRVKVMQRVALRGFAEDPDPVGMPARIPGSSLEWVSDRDGSLGTGEELTVSTLSGGTHRISLRAKDQFGATAEASIKVEVENTPPTARITSPDNGKFFRADETITFTADVSDPDGAPIDEDKIVWRSDKDGRIGRGRTFSSDRLSPNSNGDSHKVTVEVTDAHGGKASAEVRVLVTNERPVASLISPAHETRFHSEDTLLLRGRADDREDGQVQSDRLEWTATHLLTDRKLDLGNGEERRVPVQRLIDRLGFGPIQISLKAKDSDGAESEAVSARVRVENRAPTVRMANPADGDVITAGVEVTFSGFGQDPDRDQFLSGDKMVWTARDEAGNERALGTGERVKVSTLAPGRYRIVLTAIDPDDRNLKAEARARITVIAAPTATASSGGSAAPADGATAGTTAPGATAGLAGSVPAGN